MPVICGFDQSEHESVTALHTYLRRFRIKQEVYYHQYNPRRDKLTAELIPYKDYDQYHAAEFSNKNTLRKWLKTYKAEGLEWSINWLRKRKEEKGLVYAPSQAELRTLTCPSMPYYDTVAAAQGGYYGIAAMLGFQTRYAREPLDFAPLQHDAVVIQDTREQNPLILQIPTREEVLDVGDYALSIPHDRGIRIERKSLSDFCGTLSKRKVTYERKTKTTVDSSWERFSRELARAKDANLYVVMMVESDINDAQRFDYLPHTQNIKASPAYIMHNLREILYQYPLNLQVVFVNGRTEMATKMIRVLEMGDQVRRIDLQAAYERGEL